MQNEKNWQNVLNVTPAEQAYNPLKYQIMSMKSITLNLVLCTIIKWKRLFKKKKKKKKKKSEYWFIEIFKNIKLAKNNLDLDRSW